MVRQAACEAQKRRESETDLVLAEKALQHFDGAVTHLLNEYGVRPEWSRTAATEVTHPVLVYHHRTLTGKRVMMTRQVRAYEFRVDGLTLRVTEGEPPFAYTVYVLLPHRYEGLKARVRKPWRKSRRKGWYRLSGQAHLGMLLLKRGLCA